MTIMMRTMMRMIIVKSLSWTQTSLGLTHSPRQFCFVSQELDCKHQPHPADPPTLIQEVQD